jgi:deoxyribodipyrimidine photo-lyase
MRVTAVNAAPVAPKGDYVLYWMIAARRTTWSCALDHAIARCVELGVPLVVLEPLRCGYAWASDRMHAFVVGGMVDNAAAFAAAGVTYLPYVEPAAGRGRGLLAALAKRACCVVTDEQPGFFLPHMVAAAGEKLPVRLEQVDGNGVLPLRAMQRAFTTAASFRRQWQKIIAPHLLAMPAARPLAKLPRVVKGGEPPALKAWPMMTGPVDLSKLPIDHRVAPVATRGGSRAAAAVLEELIDDKLASYHEGRRFLDERDASSGLSPYLHFGHISAHEVTARVWHAASWDPTRVIGAKATGSREGWWGMAAGPEAFLDELITWRELGYGFCFYTPDFASYRTLPDWAKKTLDAHAPDQREYLYTRAQLDGAQTHDPLWNAAQRQLVRDGRIHNYLRMLWGKKILEWSPSPKAALATLIELNNRYAIDGRDPNSYSGICWTLGRFDRPWAPARPVFGTIRFMSSASTAKKMNVKGYLARCAK